MCKRGIRCNQGLLTRITVLRYIILNVLRPNYILKVQLYVPSVTLYLQNQEQVTRPNVFKEKAQDLNKCIGFKQRVLLGIQKVHFIFLIQ